MDHLGTIQFLKKGLFMVEYLTFVTSMDPPETLLSGHLDKNLWYMQF